jgi:hypothetical protein
MLLAASALARLRWLNVIHRSQMRRRPVRAAAAPPRYARLLRLNHEYWEAGMWEGMRANTASESPGRRYRNQKQQPTTADYDS